MRFGWIRLQYFLHYAVIGAYLPYMPVHLRELGFADWQLGWILGVYGVAVMVMPTLITHLADRHIGHRAMIGIGFGASGLVLAAITQVDQFFVLMALSLLFSVCYTPMFSLTDGLTFSAFNKLERDGDRPPPYVSMRIWGSFGFMAPAMAIFFVLRFTDIPAVGAIGVAAVCALTAAGMSRLLPNTKPQADRHAELPSASALRAMRRPPVVHVVIPLMLLFLAINMYYAFYSVYLGDLGIAHEWVGLIVNLGVVAEIVLMLFAAPMLKRFGVRGLFILGAASMTARMALLAMWPTATIAIVSQLFHAPIVLALYLLPPMYLNQKAGDSFRNSIQGLYGMICYGATRLTGSILGGYTSEISLQTTFAAAAGLSLIATLWFAWFFRDQPTCATIRRQHGIPAPASVPEA